MKICQKHWDRLRDKLKELGIEHLGAQTGKEVIAQAVTSMEGRDAENDYTPLMSCNYMIWSQALKALGFAAMAPNLDGSEKCPICAVMQDIEEQWINGPAQAAYEECKKRGLL